MKTTNEPTNGNANATRDILNNNVARLKFLGQAKRLTWNSKRSFRAV